MTLGSRLRAAADFVPEGSSAADIGTDHGYLPVELVRSGKCPFAVAADVNEGPLTAARHSVDSAGLGDKIEIRLGSGLCVLKEGEVDTAIFCGMGGSLIRRLLMDSPDIVKSLKRLILQPQQGKKVLRSYLCEIGWHIEDEALVKEDGRIYQVICAVPGKAVPLSDLELEIGPVLNKKRPPLFDEMVKELICRTKRSLSGMEKSDAAKNSPHYRELKKYLEDLEGLL